MMNGYEKQEFDEDVFGAKAGTIVSAFDAFPKAKPQYVTRTSGGGKWTVAVAIVSFILILSETSRWWRGEESHTFAVEKGVGRSMQINLDVVIRMRCPDVHVNVQDAAGEWVMAAQLLKREPTSWAHWVNAAGMHRLGRDRDGKIVTGEGWAHDEGFGEEHVHDIVALGRKKAKWSKTPRLWGAEGDSCRVYGSLDLNKVQGDFHITARGHGYGEPGGHLDHDAFNFSHIISELSFGPFLPSLENPLDRTVNIAPDHFYKTQYFVSVVPTIYTVGDPSNSGGRTIFTNQYAVTEQSGAVNHWTIPGIFFKYDIEPILLTIVESRASLLLLVFKVVNVVSGALVAGHWCFTLTEWAKEVLGRRRRARSDGMLGVKSSEYEE